MNYKKIAILGAGAIGSYFIYGLEQKDDIDYCVIADGDRLQRLNKDGIIINNQRYAPKVIPSDKARGADLLIVAVKYNALKTVLDDIATIADDHTVILCPMNGIDKEQIIGDAVGEEKLVYSLIKVISERKDNQIHFDPVTSVGVIYGEKDGRISARVTALDNLFEGTDIHYRSTDVILSEIWTKFYLNVGNNLIQAIVGCGMGSYEKSGHMRYLQQKLREEVMQIAKVKGIGFSDVASSLKPSAMRPTDRFSTLQDLDAHRHTEIDMFSGAIVRLGKELGIPTPYNDMTYHLIKSLEEKNDGDFDF